MDAKEALAVLTEAADYARVSQRSCAAGGLAHDALAVLTAAVERLEKAEAELAAARPLLEAVESAIVQQYKRPGLDGRDLVNSRFDGMDANAILRAALSCRAKSAENSTDTKGEPK